MCLTSRGTTVLARLQPRIDAQDNHNCTQVHIQGAFRDMDKLLLSYAHLMATCLALGVIMTTDLRLLAKMARYRCIIPITHFANPALERALGQSPVTVIADQSECSIQFKMTGRGENGGGEFRPLLLRRSSLRAFLLGGGDLGGFAGLFGSHGDLRRALGFALGAVLAAEFSLGKKGVLNMNDMLNIK